MTFGDKLKKLRKEKGMTIDQVTEKIKISRRAYIAYEQNSTRPRNREVYTRLANLYGCDVNYLLMEDTGKFVGATAALTALAGLMSATAISPLGLGLALTALSEVGVVSLLSNKTKEKNKEALSHNKDMLLEYEKEQKRFQAIASGVIYKEIISKGYSFVLGKLEELDEIGMKPDEYLVFSEDFITNWWFVYWVNDKKQDDGVLISALDRAIVLFSRMVTIAPNKKRKFSIVVDDVELFDAVLKLAGHNCYRGYATVILIDIDNIEIKKEAIIANYEEDEKMDLLPLTN